MRHTAIKTLMMVALLLVSIATFAVPANKLPITIKQSNGKSLTFILQGDEKVSWAKTLDGYTLLRGKDKQFYYAQKNAEGDLVASSVIACNEQERDAKEQSFVASLQKDLRYSVKQVKQLKARWEHQASSNVKAAQNPFPTSGTDSLLVILAQFTDLSFTYTRDKFDSMCNQPNYLGTGSIKDYFLTNSDSMFNLAIKVVGPYTLNHNMAYYGNTDDNPMGSYYFVRDAINKADADGVNFANFDNDNDGYVDDVCIIFAGTPESTTGNADEIWPHSSNMSYYQSAGYSMPYKDGKNIDRYSCSAEKRSSSQMDNIGTFCHEFGHVLGLPDEYDTDYGASGGSAISTGEWSVMCEGSYNNDSKSPALWSAAQKVRTGWMSLDTLATGQDSIVLHPITGHNDRAYRINLDNDNFIVVEQRKQQGFDAHIPGNGMLVYRGQMSKINAWINNHSNTINVNPNDRGWYIQIASGSNVNSAYAAFNGAGNRAYYIDNANNLALTSIEMVNDSTMRFNYNSQTPSVQSTAVGTTATMNSFNAAGKVLYNGNSSLVSKGIIYSLSSECLWGDTNTMVVYDSNLTDTVNISANITGLQRGTQYYHRAFAVNSLNKVGLGSILSTSTASGLGVAITQSATNVGQSSAVLNARLVSVGEGDFQSKGFVYTLNSEVAPSVDNTNSTIVIVDGQTAGNYSDTLTGLQSATTYYYRAFVTNTYGTYYGTKMSFTTSFPAITGNVISSNQAFCLGTTPEALTGTEAQGGFGSFTYLWQQRKYNEYSWSDAQGTNDLATYQPAAIEDSTYFRRIAISNQSLIARDTSNEVLLDVMISRGGHIQVARSQYTQGATANMYLRQYRGDVVDWEKSLDNNTWTSLNETAATHSETFSDLGTNYYRVKVQIDQCPAAYSRVEQIEVQSNSITDITLSEAITLTPNPSANGSFTISSDIDRAQSLIITNTLGQVVYSQKDVSLNNKTIDLDVPSGAYFINIIAQGNIITKKLIINK